MRTQQLSYIIYNSIITFIMLYIIPLVLIYVRTGSLDLLTIFIQFLPLTPNPCLWYHKSDLSFREFACILIFWSIIDLQHYAVPNAQQSDLIFLYI